MEGQPAKVTGVIRTGMRAELTVLGLDPFVVGSTDPDRLPSGRVLATVAGGWVVFEALTPEEPGR